MISWQTFFPPTHTHFRVTPQIDQRSVSSVNFVSKSTLKDPTDSCTSCPVFQFLFFFLHLGVLKQKQPGSFRVDTFESSTLDFLHQY